MKTVVPFPPTVDMVSAESDADFIVATLKKQLEAANQTFEMLTKAIDDAIWDWDIQRGSRTWNHGLRVIFGHSEQPDAHAQATWVENLHPDDRKEVLSGLQDIFDKHSLNWNAIYRYKCANGNYKYTYDRGNIVYDGVNPIRMLGAMHDIDDRYTSIEEIEKLSLVASKTDNLVIITNAAQRIEWVNDGFIKRTGYSLKDVIGKTPRILQGPDTDKSCLTRIRKGLENGKSVNEEVLNYTKSGNRIWLKLNINPVFDDSNRIIRYVAVVTDITELTEHRNTLEEKIRERTKELNIALEKKTELAAMKGRFASIVSHEFRTPLAVISLATDHIKKYSVRMTPDDINQKTETILEQVDHMTHLLEDVLSLGQTEAGKIRVNKKPINLPEFFETLKEEIEKSKNDTHKVLLHFSLANHVLQTDTNLLRNIFVNLLTNAIKFSPGKDKVYCFISETSHHVHFEIKDDGIGILDAELESIFEAFDRGTNAAHINGTGLGLSIVKKAVTLLQGEITVTSKQHHGAVFSIKLPKY